MSQYVTRNLPVIAAAASANVTEGTLVKFNGDKIVTPITATSDNIVGVALSSFDSGSVGNVALLGGGVIVKAKVTDYVAAGTKLWASSSALLTSTGSTQTFTLSPAASGSVAVTDTPLAHALETGTPNDLITVVLS